MMATLIGVYRGKSGPRRAIAKFLGVSSCDLARITDSRLGFTLQWKSLVERLEAEGHHTHTCVVASDASAAISAASAGREPCVLIDDGGGTLSMIVDWNDLALAAGNVARYERILRSKLLMY
jgi:hypothetical protein